MRGGRPWIHGPQTGLLHAATRGRGEQGGETGGERERETGARRGADRQAGRPAGRPAEAEIGGIPASYASTLGGAVAASLECCNIDVCCREGGGATARGRQGEGRREKERATAE